MVKNRKHLLLVHTVRNLLNRLVGRVGIEPTTRGLKDSQTIVSQCADSLRSYSLEMFLITAFFALLAGVIHLFSHWIRNIL